MSFSDISDAVLTAIVTYGAFAVGAVVLLAALGFPLPSTFCVVACGAFVQQGVLDLPSTLLVALLSVVLGDTLSYGMGRILRRAILARYGQTEAWRSAEAYVNRRGALAIYLTRFLLTPIAVPVNLVAGSSRYPVRRFVGVATAGELTWLLGYGALGYLFGSQWEYISDLISNASGLLVGLLITGAGVYTLVRWQRRTPEAASRTVAAAPVLTTRTGEPREHSSE
jgi:membrane protein DedA with SNARE-associated domain